MKDGQCPMCHSTEIYANPTVNFRAGPNFVDLTDYTTFIPYICASCGFTAMYIESMDDIEELLKDKGWRKVSR